MVTIKWINFLDVIIECAQYIISVEFEKVEKWWDIIWLQWLEHTTNRQNIKTHFRCNIFPIFVKWKGPVESLISEFYQTSPLDRL